jgi:hypothetical protein
MSIAELNTAQKDPVIAIKQAIFQRNIYILRTLDEVVLMKRYQRYADCKIFERFV